MSTILSENGVAEGGAATPFSLPPVLTFGAIFGGAQQTYFHGTFDEAVKHSREDATMMRRDGFLRGLLQERQLSTAGSRWHLEIDDERDPWQAAARDHLTKVCKAIPFLQQQIFLPLLENIWYGRYGVQVAWEWRQGRQAQLGDFRALTPRAFSPVNGDKIGHRYSGLPYILVHAAEGDQIKDAEVITTTLARGMLLKGSWRDRFIIARHRIEDADYFDAERGDALHGVGVRDVIFWNDWLKREYLAWLTDYIERFGLGLTLIKFESGNKPAEDRARQIADDLEGRKTVILCPYLPGEKGPEDQVVRVETPMGASEVILKILKMFDHWIRYFVTGEGTGTDDSGRHSVGGDEAALMTSAKWKLNRLDAINLADTLTLDFLGPMLRWTFPWADFPVRWAFDIDAPDVGERLSAINKLWDMGVSFDEDKLRSLVGEAKPVEGASVVSKERQLQQEAALKPLPDPNHAQDGTFTSKGKPGEQAPGGQGPETMPAGGEGNPAPAEPARTMAATREAVERFVRDYKSRMPGRNPPFEAKHPRVPIGNTDGGDWTSGNNPSTEGGARPAAPKAATPAKPAPQVAPPKPAAPVAKAPPKPSLAPPNAAPQPAAPQAAPPAVQAPAFPPDDAVRTGYPPASDLEKRLGAASVMNVPPQERKNHPQAAAAWDYAGGWFKDINRRLRVGEPLDARQQGIYEGLKQLLASPEATLPQPATVYRGTVMTAEDADSFEKKLGAAMASGGQAVLGGFVSTSFDPSTAWGGFGSAEYSEGVKDPTPVLAEVIARRGVYLDDAHQSSERELLLDETSRFRVHGFKEVTYQDQDRAKGPTRVKVVQLEQL